VSEEIAPAGGIDSPHPSIDPTLTKPIVPQTARLWPV